MSGWPRLGRSPSAGTADPVAAAVRVADAMCTCPAVHPRSATVGQVRAFFRDAHVHMALLVDGGTLVGAIERGDLAPTLADDTPAELIATLDGRSARPDALLSETLDAMKRAGRRRIAVTSDDATLLGLLCLKSSGLGFCSDTDVRARRGAAGRPA